MKKIIAVTALGLLVTAGPALRQTPRPITSQFLRQVPALASKAHPATKTAQPPSPWTAIQALRPELAAQPRNRVRIRRV